MLHWHLRQLAQDCVGTPQSQWPSALQDLKAEPKAELTDVFRFVARTNRVDVGPAA